MKKLFFAALFAGAAFVCAATVCYASTALSILEASYANELRAYYNNDEVHTPFSRAEQNQSVDLASGSLLIEETDLYLPGKNGLDVEIKRKHSTDSSNVMYSYLGGSSETYQNTLRVYQYQAVGTSEKRWVFMDSEETALATPNFSVCLHRLNRGTQYEGDFGNVFKYKGWPSTSNNSAVCGGENCTQNLTWQRDPNQIEEVQLFKRSTNSTYSDFKSRYQESELMRKSGLLKLANGWNYSSMPYVMLALTYIDSFNWEYYGIFYDGVQAYTFKVFYEKNSGTRHCWGPHVDGAAYTLSSVKPDSASPWSLEFKNAEGKSFYFKDAWMNSNTWHTTIPYKISDKYGNNIQITNENSEITIIDSMGRNIVQSKSGIKVNGSTAVSYIPSAQPKDAAEPLMETKTTYALEVRKYESDSAYNSTIYKSDMKERVMPDGYILMKTYPVTEVIYPTGASTEYSYAHFQTTEPLAWSGGATSSFTERFRKFKVTESKDIMDGMQINKFTYTYNHPSEGKDADSLSSSYKNTTTATRVQDSVVTTSIFDRYDRLTETSDNTGKKPKTLYTYINISGVSPERLLPSKIRTEWYANKYTEQTKTYDSKLRLTAETDGNYSAAYTYDDRYSQLLAKTYKTDANTTVIQTNTLSSDGKSVLQTEFKEKIGANAEAVKRKTEYEYDAYGNVSKVTEYPDPNAAATVVTQFATTYNTAGTGTMRRVKTVDGVQDADGASLSAITATENYDF